MYRYPRRSLTPFLIAFILISGACTAVQSPQGISPALTVVPIPTRHFEPTRTPFLPAAPAIPSSPTADPGFTLWIDPNLPEALRQAVILPKNVNPIDQPGPASLTFAVAANSQAGEPTIHSSKWIYALVAPFSTIPDGISSQELKDAWSADKQPENFFGHPILMDPGTRAILEVRWGPASSNAVRTLPESEIVDASWAEQSSWAIVPFESIEPRWKVLRIDGQSPLDRQFQPDTYPLTVPFRLDGPKEILDRFSGQDMERRASIFPASNRDPEKLTVLVMTGVTALVRATAWKMDTLGLLYPGRDIRDWLRNADITHISNEISFDPSCPSGNPNTASLRFCSRPEYISLLEDVGADVIELTGNHLNDWGYNATLYTIDLYAQHNFKVYAGGADLSEARQPLLIEDHGNRIAFIGCNPAGPEFDWATEKHPGSASCDLDWEAEEIARLHAEGYIPIATFQYNESYDFVPGAWQKRDFRKLAAAGAAIVSGSQAHYPQAFEFLDGNFIHYGLGNLFFDQMAPIIDDRRIYGTEREFIDRHILYDGRYINTELLTAMLEDYAKPRPMTQEERHSLLTDIFKASGW